MPRAFSPTEILAKKYKTLPWSLQWANAFANPETSGVWFVAGSSTNGKSSFVMQLVKELASLGLGKVFFNSLEEGTRKTMQDNIIRVGIESVKKHVLIGSESMDELDARLSKRKAPWAVVIDSVQFTGMTVKSWQKFKNKHSDKLLIFISHLDGKEPRGNTAKDIKYHADLKIMVEGFRAISQGRYNAGGIYVVWEEGSNKYWGNNIIKLKTHAQ